MTRIKSALELAMEKIKGQHQGPVNGEEEYIKAAKVLGRTFLQGKTGKEELREKMERYPEKSRDSALLALIGELNSKMNLDNTPHILETMQYLRQDEKMRRACAAAEELYHRYRGLLEASLTQLEEDSTQWQLKKLSQDGIRGSAIDGFNLEGLPAWQETRKKIEEEYAGALQDFRAASLEPFNKSPA